MSVTGRGRVYRIARVVVDVSARARETCVTLKFFPLTLFSLRLDPETPKTRDSWESAGLPASLEREPVFTCSILSCAGRI